MLTAEVVQRITGFRPQNLGIYQTAFVHKSASRFANGVSYERQEFLGDSVLNFVVSNYVFSKYPAIAEGELTRIRAKLV